MAITNKEFVEKLLNVVKNYKTCYASGTFGQCATNSFIDGKAKQYPKWYTKSRVNKLKALPDDTRLFDCCGLIKGVCWNFPDLKYKSNGVPEANDQGLWNMSTDKSKDFSKIEVGELLWMQGHVGAYIGNGLGIECTMSWKGNVQITAVSNIGPKSGYPSRKWTGHGKLPFISYVDSQVDLGTHEDKKDYKTIAQEIIDGKWGNGEDRKKRLKAAGYTDEEIKQIQNLVNEMCKQKEPSKEVWHTVKPGEIASKIAKDYGVSLDSIKKLNPSIKNWNLIYPGQKIRIK